MTKYERKDLSNEFGDLKKFYGHFHRIEKKTDFHKTLTNNSCPEKTQVTYKILAKSQGWQLNNMLLISSSYLTCK